jgi:hypothetical protein
MRVRDLVGFLLLAVAMLAALEIPFGVLFARHERASMASQVVSEAERLSNAFAGGPPFAGRSKPAASDRGVLETLAPDTVSEVFDTQGRHVVSRSSSGASDGDDGMIARKAPLSVVAVIEGRPTSGWIDDGGQSWFYAVQPATSGPNHVGAVAVGQSSKNADDRIDEMWAALVAFTCIAVLLAGLRLRSWLDWHTRQPS